MGLGSILGGILKPAFGLVDSLITTDDERLKWKVELEKIENSLKVEGYKYDTALAEARSSIIVAEAQSQSWLARNWRPITMLMFGGLILAVATGLTDVEDLAAVPEQLWRLLQIGIGGYIVGRSAEKIVPQVFEKKKDA
jgi:hypothetical protein